MKFIMKIAILVMTVVTLFVMVLATRQVFFQAEGDFQNGTVLWSLIAVLGCFTVVQVIALFLQPFSLKKAGFYILHTGFVLVLAGCMLYYLAGIKISGTYPVSTIGSSANAAHQSIKYSPLKGEGYTANFNSFNLGVTNVKTEYYDPAYVLYRIIDEEAREYEVISDDIYIGKNGTYDFGEYGVKSRDQLIANEDFQQVELAQNIVASPRNPSPQYYGASIQIYNKSKDTEIKREISVNHPVRVNGWKIFLINTQSEAATFYFKYDPGEYITLAGMWLVIVGSFVTCFYKPKHGGKAGDGE